MDRPLECSACQEPAALIYKQLSGTSCSQETLCKNCPILKQRFEDDVNSLDSSLITPIACEECGTRLHDVLRHEPLGCAHCYEVFDQAICQRLNFKKLEYKQDVMINKNSLPTSDQLLRLSKDLQDAVSSENFEKAALLRDEINKLKQMMSES